MVEKPTIVQSKTPLSNITAAYLEPNPPCIDRIATHVLLLAASLFSRAACILADHSTFAHFIPLCYGNMLCAEHSLTMVTKQRRNRVCRACYAHLGQAHWLLAAPLSASSHPQKLSKKSRVIRRGSSSLMGEQTCAARPPADKSGMCCLTAKPSRKSCAAHEPTGLTPSTEHTRATLVPGASTSLRWAL